MSPISMLERANVNKSLQHTYYHNIINNLQLEEGVICAFRTNAG